MSTLKTEDFKRGGVAYPPDWHFDADLPEDRTYVEKTFKVLKEYSGIPADKVEEHVFDIREKAWKVFPYPCIGSWRFLADYLVEFPEYPEILARIKAGDIFLDAGCCFGQVLRHLMLDGAPAANLKGTDLYPKFIEQGYDLFKDEDKCGLEFITGDMLNHSDPSLDVLDGKMDIIHGTFLFHLFNRPDQIKLATRLVKFFKPDAKNALIVGRHTGQAEPLDPFETWTLDKLDRFLHTPSTWQALWDEVGELTGTKWVTTAEVVFLKHLDIDDNYWAKRKEITGDPNPPKTLRFCQYRYSVRKV
ncbi:uncharacterized protein RAG0_16102 [Rhynchosporium agropyri]|uniref:Methyltransferase domain-containing protein n=1 Tax=Rhynchosporium agropyri TaxID=914238 RepID=A0A1E1LNW5_9HELO|nr:uncharacterized protein RAG0_16102 [Rhynchosporium agropyri]